MQKLITVVVDTTQIVKKPGSPFTINEVETLNEWLALGWEIEEWDFLKEAGADGEIILLVTLNDDAIYEPDEFLDEDFNDNDEDEEGYNDKNNN